MAGRGCRRREAGSPGRWRQRGGGLAEWRGNKMATETVELHKLKVP